MCGLLGCIGSNASPQLADDLQYIDHRGPDNSHFHFHNGVFLGHSRLSIIAPNNGQQPLYSADRQTILICNGEIFNHHQLRGELSSRGHQFQTASDSEVILHLYREVGMDCLQSLEGQFSFAIWDNHKQQLHLARDRTGILPLFYCMRGDNLCFASEIKALLPQLEQSPIINPQTLKQIFTFWSPLAGETQFQGIHQLRPGHRAVFELGKITQTCYWDWNFPSSGNFLTNENEALEEFTQLLQNSVTARQQADTPVASFLSGGLDSTSVVASCADKPATYSIGFSKSKQHDESAFQSEAADYFGVEQHHSNCEPQQVADNFSSTIWHTECSILRTAPTPLKQLAQSVNNDGIKVVLTGEGADEILGGYDIFKETKIRQFWARQPNSSARPALLSKLYPYMEGNLSSSRGYLEKFFSVGLDHPQQPFFSHLPRWSTTSACQNFFSDDLKQSLQDYDPIDEFETSLPAEFDSWHWLNRAQYVEAHTLLSGYLLPSQSDRMLMSASIEGRYPFLDHNLIEFCNKLHPKLKIKGLNEKWLLKAAMKDKIPESIRSRNKQPYRAPDSASFFNPAPHPIVEEMMNPARINSYGYFCPTKVKFLVQKLARGATANQRDNMAFIGILSTQLWHKHFIEDYNTHFSCK